MIGWSGLAVGRRCEPVGSWSILAVVILAPFGGGDCRGQSAAAGEGMHVERKVWTSLGLGGGGAMFTPAISPADPDAILLNCDMGGAYLTTDGGRNWELLHYRQLTSSTTVRPVWHPRDRAVAFAAGGWRGSLKVTRDQGRSWSGIPGAPSQVTAIGIDPGNPQRMLVGSSGRIHRSADGGKTWQTAEGGRGRVREFHFDQTSPPGSRTCFAATERAILRSDDGGAAWREVSSAPRALLSFTGGSNQESRTCVLYCTVAGKEGEPVSGTIYRSDDRGETWRPLLFPVMSSPQFNVGPSYLIDERGGGRDTISGFGINPVNPDQVVVTDWMSCSISRDGGTTWFSAHTRAEDPSRRGPGMRWINNGLVVTTVWHYDIDPFEANRHYISYTDIGFARSTDAGKTWLWQAGPPLRNTTYELAFDPETPGLIWGAFSDLHDIPNNNVISGRHDFPGAGGGVGRSTDFGATWKDSSEGLPGTPVISVAVDPNSPKGSRTLYASAFGDGVYKSTDGGRHWIKASQGLGNSAGSLRACRLILHGDGMLFCLVTALRKEGRFVAEGPGLYRSADGGASWTWINQSHPLLWPKDFDVDPRDSRVIYLGAADAGGQTGGLFKTTDGGASWARVARHGTDCFGATVDPRNPDRVYLCIAEGGPEPGLWRSEDAGKTWSPIEGLPFNHVQRVSFDRADPTVIYVSTFGASAWRGPAR